MTSPLRPVYSPDNLDGTYKNPIIHADYSDPDLIRVGEDYYMTASSFSCFPGLPILHSRDLVNWTIVAHAVEKYPAPFAGGFDMPRHGDGIWAPAIRYQNGEFYIYWGDPDYGVFMVKARDATGPWNPPVLVKAARGWIDTCPFWDDDGTAYLVHAFALSRAGINNTLDICKMSADGTKLLDEGTRVFDGGTNATVESHTPTPPNPGGYITVEGPKLYKRNGYYYIFAPGGSVAIGYQIVFRAKNILGPYDSRIVLEQGDTPINGPHQGGWITTQTGEDWFMHFQDRNAYGRVTHLQPMRWTDDWPVIGEPEKNDPTRGTPVLKHKMPNVGPGLPNVFLPLAAPQTSDDFAGPTLGLQWQWFANFDPAWVKCHRSGAMGAAGGGGGGKPPHLELTPVSLDDITPLYSRPNLLLQKFPAEQFTVTTKLDASSLAAGETAGLVVVGPSTASLTVYHSAMGCKVVRTSFQLPRRPAATLPAAPATATAPSTPPPLPPDIEQDPLILDTSTVYLRVEVASGARCTFSASPDGQTFTPLGRPFTAVKDQWIGAKVGIFANAPPNTQPKGHADFEWFHVQ